MKITSIAEAERTLTQFYEVTNQVIGQGITIDRMQRLMAHLGKPERSLRVVHVAGTSGKTSTTYYIATLLHSSGFKVGSTVSPHIDSITERVQINGKPLSNRQFCEYLGEFMEFIVDAPEKPTWFEVLVAFAFWVFAQEKVEYAVLETGLGGLQDGTNVTEHADKVCVITDIGFDHMHILGNTLGAIAAQKAGIIHDGNSALMYDQSPEVMQPVRYWVSQQEDAELYTFEQQRLEKAYKDEFVPDLPDYQKRNWLLAYAAYRFLAKRDEFVPLEGVPLQATQQTRVPGRMDKITVAGKTIIMDGAHNEQKMRAFADSFRVLYPGRKVPVLLALKRGKEAESIAPYINAIASQIIITTFDQIQDTPNLSLAPEIIAKALKIDNKKGVAIIHDPQQAYKQFLEVVDDVGVVTGSFFLISQLREAKGKA